MSRATPRRALVVASVALTMTLAACSGGDDGSTDDKDDSAASSSPSESASGSPSESTSVSPGAVPSEEPSGPPASFDSEAATTFPEVDVREVALSDTHALVLTPQKVVGRTFPDFDLAFEVAASAGNITDLEIGEDGESVYVVEVGTQTGSGTELGTVVVTLRQIDLASGEVEDLASAQVPQEQFTGSAPATGVLAGVQGEVAVVDLWSGASGGTNPFEVATTRHRTLALDLAAGDLAWSLRPARPVAVLRDAVVLNTGRPRRPAPLRAVALADGKRRWEALPGTAQAARVGVDGDAVVVATARVGRSRGQVNRLDAATGRTSAPTAEVPSWNLTCRPTTEATQAVCSVGGVYSVFGWDLRENTRTWRLPRPGHVGAQVTDVFEDVAYGQLADGRTVTLDALTGEDRGDSTTGSALVVGRWGGMSILDGQAVFVPAVA